MATNRSQVQLDPDTKQLLRTIHDDIWGDAGAPFRLTVRLALEEYRGGHGDR